MKIYLSLFLLMQLFLGCGSVDSSSNELHDGFYVIMVGAKSFTYENVIVGRLLDHTAEDDLFPTVFVSPNDKAYHCTIYVDGIKTGSYQTAIMTPISDNEFSRISIVGYSEVGFYVYVVKKNYDNIFKHENMVCVYKMHADKTDLDFVIEKRLF